MSAFPQYKIDEANLHAAMAELAAMSLNVQCVREKYYLEENKAFYREWEVSQSTETKVIMWDQHAPDRQDNSVFVTFGTPNWRKGADLFRKVETTLIKNGAAKRDELLPDGSRSKLRETGG